MLDVESMISALHLSLLRRLLDSSGDAKWKEYAQYDLRSSSFASAWGLGLRICFSAVNMATRKAFVSPFWRQTLLAAQQLHLRETQPNSVEQVLRQSLFYNSSILGSRDEPLASKPLLRLAKAGITTVGDLFDNATSTASRLMF